MEDKPKQTRIKYVSYTCPRCSYASNHKQCMRAHLYSRKVPCPAVTNNIDLTDLVKECVLANRIYNVPKPIVPAKTNTIPSFTQQINNTQVIQNFVANMDVVEKLEKYVTFNKTKLTSFEKSIEDKFASTNLYLERNKGMHLDTEDLIGIIDDVSIATDPSGFNIMYDKKIGKVKVYDTDRWDEHQAVPGIRRILENIQEFYLNAYEAFLLRIIANPNTHFEKRQESRNHVEEYYRFIACFDLHPYVQGRCDQDILYYCRIGEYTEKTGAERCDITDEFLGVFGKQRKKVTDTDKKRMIAQVTDILKKNTTKNTGELNKKIIVLCNMQDDFKNVLSRFGIDGA